MKGSAFINALPKKWSSERERMILDAVRNRDIVPITWDNIVTHAGQYSAIIKVSRDALRVGDPADSVRVSVNHRTAQHILDDLGAAPLTAKLSDEIWNQAPVRLAPLPHLAWVNDGTMSDTARMLEQSRLVDSEIAKEQTRTGRRGLVADVGKDWIVDRRLWEPPIVTAHCTKDPIRSVNYGWHGNAGYPSTTLPGVMVIQDVGTCHDLNHTDYSQVVRAVRRDVKVCGPGMGETGCAIVDIDAIATDPALAGLVSYSGALPELRHPAVLRSCEPGVRCPMQGQGFIQLSSETSCPLRQCEPLPPPGPSPVLAGTIPTSAGGKLLYFGAGAVVGYYGFMMFDRWLRQPVRMS